MRTTSPLRRATSIAAFKLALLTPCFALAGDPALAEALFRQARAAMDSGDYESACPKLEESFAQDRATGTLLALALCQEEIGKIASAWANYTTVVSMSKRDGQEERERAARERRDALEPKLSRVTIQIAEATASLPGLLVKRDGLVVGQGAWGAAAPVDPGEHTVEASAPGKQSWSTNITVGSEADAQTVVVPELEDLPAEAAAPEPSPAPEAPATSSARGELDMPRAEARASEWPLSTIGLAVGGLGVVGLGVSTYFGIRAKNLDADSSRNGRCDADNACTREGLALRRDAVDASNLATVFLVAGSVATAAGVTLFFLGEAREHDAARLEVTPAVGPDVAAMFVRGNF